MAVIIITGGTGMIGKAVTKLLLAQGHELIILTRNSKNHQPSAGVTYAEWNPAKQLIESTIFERAEAVIHLAGAGVAERRWTKKRREEIMQSRVLAGKLLVNTLRSVPNKINTVISASAIGWYGQDEPLSDHKFEETDPPAVDFLATVCTKWEESILPVQQDGKRLVIFRIGIVLSADGGAWKEFRRPLKWGIAAALGSGKQIISWIHIDDLVNMFLSAIENKHLDGIYNAVAPHPVSNKELIRTMAKARKKRILIHMNVPAFLLRIMLGKMSVEILKSATVSSNKIIKAGFSFQYPDIGSAAASLSAKSFHQA